MDPLLKDGDFLVDGRGYPIPCTGMQELLQRALIRLTVPQGSFDLDPQLGSRLHLLRAASSGMAEQALDCVREALLPIPELTPLRVEARQMDARENVSLTVWLQAGNQRQELEVTL